MTTLYIKMFHPLTPEPYNSLNKFQCGSHTLVLGLLVREPSHGKKYGDTEHFDIRTLVCPYTPTTYQNPNYEEIVESEGHGN